MSFKSTDKTTIMDLPNELMLKILSKNLSNDDIGNYLDALNRGPLNDKDAQVLLSEQLIHNCKINGLLQGSKNSIINIKWSPDGKKLALFIDKKTVEILDVTYGHILNTLIHPEGGILSMAWNPDSYRIAIGSDHGQIKIWNIISGQLLKTLEGHNGRIFCLAWNPKNTDQLVSGGSGMINDKFLGKSIRIWDSITGNILKELEGDKLNTRSVAWSHDGEFIASGGFDSFVKIWRVKDGTLINTLDHDGGIIHYISWNSDDTKIVSIATHYRIKLWELNNDESGYIVKDLNNPYTRTNLYSRNDISDIVFNPDNSIMAVSYQDGYILFYKTEENFKKYSEPLKVLKCSQEIKGLVWGPKNEMIISYNNKNILKWDISDLQQTGGKKPKQKAQKHIYKGKSYTVRIGAKGGRYILVGSEKKKVYI